MRRKTDENLMREDRLRRARRRQNNAKLALVMLCTLVVLVIIMYCGTALYLKITGGEPVVEDEVLPAAADPLVYSQEEFDRQLSEEVSRAVSQAVQEEEEKTAQAVEAAQQQTSAEILGGIKAGLSNGDTVLETLRPLYPDELVVASGGRYHFVPINRDLKQNDFVQENVNILDSGEIQYLLDGQVVSHKGIDVSKHQGTIDWNKVAQDGVEFAFIRVALRGYSTGKLVEDEYFDRNIQGAQAAGIKVGVYIYSQAVNETELLEEAQLVLDKIAPYNIECPVVFDVELVSGAKGRMNDISLEERTNLTLLFCQTIENAGYRPMIYHNTEMGALMIDIETLEDYDKWFASYSETLYYPYAYKIWQYTPNGRVAGIGTEVDLNICFEPIWEE